MPDNLYLAKSIADEMMASVVSFAAVTMLKSNALTDVYKFLSYRLKVFSCNQFVYNVLYNNEFSNL